MNWLILIPFGIFVAILVIFLIRKNQKDEKDFEKTENYINQKEDDNDLNTEEVVK